MWRMALALAMIPPLVLFLIYGGFVTPAEAAKHVGETVVVQGKIEQIVLSGGLANVISNDTDRAVIAGGERNLIELNSDFTAVGGGYYNRITSGASFSAIGGGADNSISNATRSVIAGGVGVAVRRWRLRQR